MTGVALCRLVFVHGDALSHVDGGMAWKACQQTGVMHELLEKMHGQQVACPTCSNDKNGPAPSLAAMFPADFVSFLGPSDFVLVSDSNVRVSCLASEGRGFIGYHERRLGGRNIDETGGNLIK